MGTLTIPIVKKMLKKLQHTSHEINYTSYYEHCPYIISKLSNKPPPSITQKQEELFKKMFKEIQEPFQKYCPKDRVNFLSYSYVLHKFCELLELDHLLICFPLLKSTVKLRSQDEIWEKICDELNWQSIPSV